MKSNEQLRKEFEEQTGNKAIVFPACHGETGYASWEYQLWLEQKLLEEYAQQSQPSGMRWVRASERMPVEDKKYLCRHLKTKYPVAIWLHEIKSNAGIIEWLDESSPAGAAEGVKRYETVVNDTGFDKSSEHYVNNVFMRNANVWSDEYDWMMTKDRFVDVVSLFFTTTQPASEGISKIRQVMNWISQCVDEDHDLEVSEIKMIWNDLSDAISLIESTPHSSEGMAEALYTYQDMMNVAGWMAAADNKRPVHELKEEAEVYISKIKPFASLSPAGDDGRGPEERRSDALEWWDKVDKVDRFAMLKKYGYQDEKKPWKYRPLTDKGIYLMWCRENGG